MEFIYILNAAAGLVKTILSILCVCGMYKCVTTKDLLGLIFYGFLFIATKI